MALANGLTPKQEAFATAYVESGNAAAAYRQAYNAEKQKETTVWPNASRLLANSKVKARVEQIQQAIAEEVQERVVVTVESITKELEEARLLAKEVGQAGAAVSASLGKAKLHGLITDKAEHTGKDGAPLVPAVNLTINK